MYILLTGRMPFETRQGNVLDAHRAVVSDTPKYDTNMSSGAKDLVKRMLVKNPKKRISIVDILKHDWIVNSVHHSDERKNIQNMDHIAKLRGRRRFVKATMLVKWAGREAKTKKMFENSFREHLRGVDEKSLIRLRDSVVSRSETKTYDRQHFKTACLSAGEPWQSLRLDVVFEKFDLDDNKELEWKEIFLGFLSLLPKSPMKLRACFVLLDQDGSGDLGPEELRKLFEYTTSQDDVDVLRKLRHAMESLDVNVKSGTVSYDSFRCVIEHDKILKSVFLGDDDDDGDIILSTPSKVSNGAKSFKNDTPMSTMTQTDSEDEDGI